MAGQFGRAYSRIGSNALDNVVNIFKDMAEKQRQRDALTNAMNLYKQFQGKMGDISNASTTQYQPTETQTSPNLFPDQPNVVSSLLNKSVGIQPRTDFNMLGKQVTTPLPQVEKYNQGQNAVGDFLMELMKTPDISSVNPNVLNTLQAYIRQRADQLKPDVTEWKSIPQGSELAGFSTKTGQPIGQKITNPKAPTARNPFTKEGSDGYYYNWDEGSNSFKKTNLKVPSDKKGDGTGKKSKGYSLDKDSAKYIAILKNPPQYRTDQATGLPIKYAVDDKGNYKQDPKTGQYVVDDVNGKPVPYTDDEKNYLKSQAYNYLQLQMLSPRAYQFSNNIEKKYGRPLSSQELGQEAIKHTEEGNLTDQEAKEIADYLKYVQQFDK